MQEKNTIRLGFGANEPERKLINRIALASVEFILKVGIDAFIKMIDVDTIEDLLEYNPSVKQRMVELKMINTD